MRLFGSDRIARWMDQSGAEEGEVITRPLVTRAIEQAQKRVELQNFQQPEAAARVRRRDEPAAGGGLLAAAVRAGAGRGAQGRSAPDDRRRAGAGGHPVPGGAERPEEYDRGGLRRGAHAAVPGDGGSAHRRRRPRRHGRDGRAAKRRARTRSGGRSSTCRISGRRSGFPKWTRRCCRR